MRHGARFTALRGPGDRATLCQGVSGCDQGNCTLRCTLGPALEVRPPLGAVRGESPNSVQSPCASTSRSTPEGEPGRAASSYPLGRRRTKVRTRDGPDPVDPSPDGQA